MQQEDHIHKNSTHYRNKCLGCPIPVCGRCVNCRDKPTDGGPNILRQRCTSRRCRQGTTNGERPKDLNLNPDNPKQENINESEGVPDM